MNYRERIDQVINKALSLEFTTAMPIDDAPKAYKCRIEHGLNWMVLHNEIICHSSTVQWNDAKTNIEISIKVKERFWSEAEEITFQKPIKLYHPLEAFYLALYRSVENSLPKSAALPPPTIFNL